MRLNTYFISDCHLSDDTPELLQLFEALMHKLQGAKAVYILGDLFDVWVGDDIQTQASQRVCHALNQLKASGTTLYFMAGNRDFLLGNAMAKKAGWQPLNHHHILKHQTMRVCLTHGDLLCTDDIAYQKYRRWARNPLIMRLFKLMPKSFRLGMAQKLRAKSKAYQASQATIIDVNQKAVQSWMLRHQVSYLIHGHTHSPNIHQTQHGQRIVLGDWNKQHAMIGQLSDNTIELVDAYEICHKLQSSPHPPKAVSG